MTSGLDADAAISLIRSNRADIALFNEHYVEWLRKEAANFLAAQPKNQAA
jgi:hypothetical protein